MRSLHSETVRNTKAIKKRGIFGFALGYEARIKPSAISPMIKETEYEEGAGLDNFET